MINHGCYGLLSHLARRLPLGLLFCGLWLTSTVQATPLLQDLGVGQVQVLEDPSASATLGQIQTQRHQFTNLETTTPDYSYTASAYWFHMPVQNQGAASATFYLSIKNSILDYATLYVVTQGGLAETVQSGDRLPARERAYPATDLVLPFHLTAGESAELYLRVQSEASPLLIPFVILNEKGLQESVIAGWVLHSAILGIFGALLIYNLFIFSLLRSRLYFYYALYLPIAYLSTAALGGFGSAYLTPQSTWLSNEGLGVFMGLSFALVLLVTREFLQTRTAPQLDRWVHFFTLSALLLSFSSFFVYDRISSGVRLAMTLIYPLFAMFIAWRRGHTEARFYILGQAASWIGLVLFGLFGAGVLPYHLLLYEAPSLGAATDALLLSLALADRIRMLQRARLQAEEQARQNLEIRQEELERLVAERTAEIKTLHGILPICANCKKIRDEEGAWQGLETYISQHTDAQFSHGICTDCMKTLYPTVYQKRQPGAASKP